MANILDRYGIKEVADVTFYKIDPTTGNPAEPVLYLDTLKVSTIEQTAENTSARGGKGNPELIVWDYNKEITVTLEDALFSAKSMAVMFGSGGKDVTVGSSMSTIYKTVRGKATADGTVTAASTVAVTINGKSAILSGLTYYDVNNGASVATVTSGKEYIISGYLTNPSEGSVRVINIDANTFPGTYYITGDTYARSEVDGTDEFFQFIIPKAKVNSEVTLTMEAEGDPSTFSMTLKVLRPANGEMMKLVQYKI